MKRIFHVPMAYRVFILLLFTTGSAFSQTAEIIQFSAEQQNENIKLSWTVGLGMTCYNVIIERSADSTSGFQPLHMYPGVCGSISAEEHYAYVDEDPIHNAFNFYRLDYGDGFTRVAAVRHTHHGDDGYSLSFDPASRSAVVRFNNPQHQRFTFALYDVSGRLAATVSGTTDDELTIDAQPLPNGLYVFRFATQNGTAFVGKLAVR